MNETAKQTALRAEDRLARANIRPEDGDIAEPGEQRIYEQGEDPKPNGQDKRRRLGLIGWQDIRLTNAPPYLVKGLVPREGLTVLWGPPKSGKSFWAFDLALAVALGSPYRERRVQQGPVVYCAAEGATGLRARVEAYRQRHLADHESAVPFYLVPDTFDLTADAADLIASFRATLGNDLRPVLVVLDTLNRTMTGSENDPADMGKYVKAADAIRDAFACVVLIVHHCGTEGSRPRGHTSLTGAADAQLAVKRTADGLIAVTVEWMKDGPEGDTLYSRLEVVEVGRDSDGEVITSCVVVEAEASEAETSKRPKLNPRYRRALDTLTNVVADHGVLPPDLRHYPSGVKLVPIDLWRRELEAVGVLDPDASNPRADWRRIKDILADRGYIGLRGDFAWLS